MNNFAKDQDAAAVEADENKARVAALKKINELPRSESVSEQAHPRWVGMWEAGLKIGDAFDIGFSCPALVNEIALGRIPEGRALVPGCGRGYDVYALASPTRLAIGVELSEKALEAARELKQECLTPENATFQVGDFFKLSTTPENQFDFVYDYTFLCAFDPSVRQAWAIKMSELVKPGGLLMTLVFPICEKTGGPPFAVSLEMVEGLLMGSSGTSSDGQPLWEKERLELLPPEMCHPGRDGQVGGFQRPGMIAGGRAASGIGRWRRL